MPENTCPDYRLAHVTVIDFLRELFPNVPAADFQLQVNSYPEVMLYVAALANCYYNTI
ncbi:uncharacterized protein BKA55DRAFT_585091, partial [Fusarium redolens]